MFFKMISSWRTKLFIVIFVTQLIWVGGYELSITKVGYLIYFWEVLKISCLLWFYWLLVYVFTFSKGELPKT